MRTPADPMKVILELTRTLAQTCELDRCMQAVTDSAMALMACDHCSIRIFDDSNEQLLAAARSGSGTAIRPVGFRVGEGVVGWVAAENRAVRIADTVLDERFKTASSQGFRIRSLVAAPLSAGPKVVGVLSATSPTPEAFSEADELLAQVLANIAVPAIERFRLELLSLTDPVTLTLNRRALLPRLEEELERAKRYGSALTLMIVELMGVEKLLRGHGHDAADEFLRAIAQRLKHSVRRADVLLRKSTAEFAIIMPHTDRKQSAVAARRLKHELDMLFDERMLAGTLHSCIGTVLASESEAAEPFDARCAALMKLARESNNCAGTVSDED